MIHYVERDLTKLLKIGRKGSIRKAESPSFYKLRVRKRGRGEGQGDEAVQSKKSVERGRAEKLTTNYTALQILDRKKKTEGKGGWEN